MATLASGTENLITGSGLNTGSLTPTTLTNANQEVKVNVTDITQGIKGTITFKLGNITHKIVIAVK